MSSATLTRPRHTCAPEPRLLRADLFCQAADTMQAALGILTHHPKADVPRSELCRLLRSAGRPESSIEPALDMLTDALRRWQVSLCPACAREEGIS